MTSKADEASGEPPRAPSWTETATPQDAFLQGLRATPLTPGIILFCAMIGFGAFARDAGFSLAQSLFITATIFQLPGQVALVDQTGRGAAALAVAFAVLLTAIRLLPMTVVLMPYLRGAPLPRVAEYA
ncbi:MAG: AzlC family ABC transporter permease, partial [Pseudomonadota bacterium]